MRTLALAALLALIAVGCSGGDDDGSAERVVAVAISSAMPYSDPEDTENTLAARYWLAAPTVTARVLRDCTGLRLAVGAKASFNGRPSRHWTEPYLGGGGDEALGRRRAGFVLRSREEGYAAAGDTLEFTARATCVLDGKTVRAQAVRRFPLPAVTCAGGPLSAFDVHGGVTVLEDEDEPAVTLRSGELVRPGSVVVERGGRAVLGAAECNGWRVSLAPGRTWIGAYDVYGRGDSFSGAHIEAVGDRHAGGFAIGTKAHIEPLGAQCGGCPLASPSRYRTRSLGGPPGRAVVRVDAGRVRVRAGRTAVVVGPGRQTSVVCTAPTQCAATRPRLFQPNEAWTTPVGGGERPVRRVLVTEPGKRPAAAELAPLRSKVELKRLPAGGGVPEQLFVRWGREVRTKGAVANVQPEQGMLVWQAKPRGARTEWRVVYARRYAWSLFLATMVGDVTGDGHADVLVNGSQGSGGCGPWRLVATVAGRVREVFFRDTCETRMELRAGALVIDEPIGPCPHDRASAHCSGGRREVEKRWRGNRLVTARIRIRCALPRLDPKRGCRPRRR